MDDATAIVVVVVVVGSLLLLFGAVDASNNCTNCDHASGNRDQGQQATGGGCCRGGWDTGKGFVDGCCGRKNSLSVGSERWSGGYDSS